ncbi:MAG: DUF3868 domain-containing protein [Dysgonamonadaceae bacterium]|jgi:tetratricopeptide (TPR) repeat protein|nr:DUF3868 domain-containing protein [Dysgonamonadaceae bacterium]
MFNKNHIQLLAILLVFIYTSSIYGQDRLLDCVVVENNRSKITNQTVTIDFDIVFKNTKMPSLEQLTLTPKLVAPGMNSLKLKPVIVNGSKRDKLYKRSLWLNDKTANDPEIYSAVVLKKNQDVSIHYVIETPLNPWMKDARIMLVKDLCGCSGYGRDYEESLIASNINFGNFAVNFTDPPRESPKKRHENGQAFLIYNVGKWDIMPELYENSKELKKIENSWNFVSEEPTAVITAITIKSYASPEGPYENNLELSKKRAESLRTYLQTFYKITPHLLSSNGFGEDWETLYKLVEKDTKITHKNEVLHIIKSVGIFDGREKQLIDLAGGQPYRYMLDILFPFLRRSDYEISYEVPEFTVEKGKELLRTKPQMLSLKEMYVIANTYEKGSNEFVELFNIAYRVFPYDKYANLNVAASMLLRNDFKAAEEILKNYKDEPESWNNLGIVYMQQNNFEEAEKILQKALKQGIKEAEYNLATLQEIKQVYAKYNQE